MLAGNLCSETILVSRYYKDTRTAGVQGVLPSLGQYHFEEKLYLLFSYTIVREMQGHCRGLWCLRPYANIFSTHSSGLASDWSNEVISEKSTIKQRLPQFGFW